MSSDEEVFLGHRKPNAILALLILWPLSTILVNGLIFGLTYYYFEWFNLTLLEIITVLLLGGSVYLFFNWKNPNLTLSSRGAIFEDLTIRWDEAVSIDVYDGEAEWAYLDEFSNLHSGRHFTAVIVSSKEEIFIDSALFQGRWDAMRERIEEHIKTSRKRDDTIRTMGSY